MANDRWNVLARLASKCPLTCFLFTTMLGFDVLIKQAPTFGTCLPIPRHALHEKGLQKQIGVGPSASSSEQRAFFVPRINRGSMVVNRFLSSIGLHRLSFARASEGSSRRVVYDSLESKKDHFFLANRPASAPPRLIPPCPTPSLTACCMSGFWIIQFCYKQ